MGMLEQSLGIRQGRSAKLGEGSFPGHGSEPSTLPPPAQYLELEPAVVLRHLASFSDWTLASVSSVGKALLKLWPLGPNSRMDISQRQHLQKW